ncbi:tRNA (adenosine(37)-N6)-threonylcarbamoyltransferase complex ATPase subunit type 1 TsaE [Alkaliphilus crotonatoxidans]
MICKKIYNEEATAAVAIRLAEMVNPGDIICLSGDLGAGKTTFTQYFARGLQISEAVTSPTFTIIQEYDGRLPLYHFDVYRISNPFEMEDIGYEEYFYGDGVCIIEWPTQIEPLLPEDYLWIDLTVVDESERNLCVRGTNDYYQNMIEELFKE